MTAVTARSEGTEAMAPAARQVPRPGPATRLSRRAGDTLHALVAGPWLFPVLVVTALLVLVAFSLNGSSTGIMHIYLYGNGDPHLLLGGPRGIRSDEWLVNTPMTLAQQAAGYPHVNHNLGAGLDVSLVYEVPYTDWSAVFRPQLWGYAVLPAGPAFAWKWWALAAILLLGSYWLLLQLMPRRRLVSALLAVGVLWNPFVQWWFLAGTLAPLAWGIVAGAAFLWILSATRQRTVVLGTLLLGFAIGAFGLALYPPFQVPVAIVVTVLCVGRVLLVAQQRPRGVVLRRIGAGLAGVAIGGAVVGLFLLTRLGLVHAFLNTAYPGSRSFATGGFPVDQLFSGSYDHQLTGKAATANGALAIYGNNQTEASTSLVIGVFLLAVQVWLLVRARRMRLPVNPTLLLLPLVAALFMVDLFVPGADLLAKLTLLDQVQHARLTIGFGLLSVLMFAVTAGELDRLEVRPPWWLVAPTFVVATLFLYRQGRSSLVHVPTLASSGSYVTVVSVGAAAVVALWCLGRRGQSAAAVALAGFALYAGGSVQPLSSGLFSVADTPLGGAIRSVDAARPGVWVSTLGLLGNPILEETGVHTYSADYSYPSFGVWTDLDPTGRYRDIYNRYAHVLFTDFAIDPPLQNPQPDVVSVHFDACSVFAQRDVVHLLTDHRTGRCTRLDQVVKLSGRTFYLYDIVPR